MTEIKIVYVSTEKIKPSTYNPRKISTDAMKHLKESISKFHVVDPIIVNSNPERENVVIGGHMRLKAAKEMGMTEVPVVYVNLGIEAEKELNLRLNKNTGEWDFSKLKDFEPEFLADIGFSDLDLSLTFNDTKTEEEFDVEKELKKIIEPITKKGDLIILGKHKLYCGDATLPESIKILFGDERASMIYSDPVYNLKMENLYSSGVGGKKDYGPKVMDNRSFDEYKNFLRKSMTSALSVSKEDCHFFYYSDQTYIGVIQDLYRELGIENKRVCLWIKNSQNPTPNVAFNKCYEPCTYGVKGNPSLTKNITKQNEIMNEETTTGNDLYDEMNDLWLVKRLSGKEMEHGTSKPPQLHEKAIKRCTKPNDIILDSFLGSGSTILAAETLKRRVYGTELEPRFCDLIIKRFEKFTGIKAKIIHEDEGR